MAPQSLDTLRRLANRRGIGFAYALVAMIVMLVLGLTFMQVGMSSRHNAYKHKGDTQAFMLAEAGVDHAAWVISTLSAGDATHETVAGLMETAGVTAPITYTSTACEMNGGRYFFEITYPYNGMQDAALVDASGVSKTGEQERIRTIQRLLTEDPVRDVVEHAMFSDHNLALTGNLSLDGKPDQGGKGAHANGNVTMNGNPTVIGDVSATGTITPVGNPNISGAITPFSDRIGMPEVDLQWYRDNADEILSGRVRYASHWFQTGTLEDPRIYFIDGDLTMNGNVDGVGIVVCTGDVTINGNIDYASDESLVAVISTGVVKVTGNSEVSGLIYAHNVDSTATITTIGNTHIFGAVVGDTLTGHGDMLIEFDPRLADMGDLPGLGDVQVDVVSWERNPVEE